MKSVVKLKLMIVQYHPLTAAREQYVMGAKGANQQEEVTYQPMTTRF